MSSEASWAVHEERTGITVARGWTPSIEIACQEATRYAAQYAEEGPVTYWVKQGRKMVVRGSYSGGSVSEQ